MFCARKVIVRTQVDFPRAIVLRLAAHRDQLDDQGAIVKESNFPPGPYRSWPFFSFEILQKFVYLIKTIIAEIIYTRSGINNLFTSDHYGVEMDVQHTITSIQLK